VIVEVCASGGLSASQFRGFAGDTLAGPDSFSSSVRASEPASQTLTSGHPGVTERPCYLEPFGYRIPVRDVQEGTSTWPWRPSFAIACDPLNQAERRCGIPALRSNRWEFSLAAGRWRPGSALIAMSAVRSSASTQNSDTRIPGELYRLPCPDLALRDSWRGAGKVRGRGASGNHPPSLRPSLSTRNGR
jgi:hypothetical protein